MTISNYSFGKFGAVRRAGTNHMPLLVFRCVRRMRLGRAGHANHRRAQHALVKHITGLHFADHDPVRMFGGFHALNRVMIVRIELLPHRIDSNKPLLRQRFPELPPDQLEAPVIVGVRRIAGNRESPIEGIEHRKQAVDERLDAAMTFLMALLLHALAEILEIRLAADECIHQLLLFGEEFPKFIRRRRIDELRNRLGSLLVIRGRQVRIHILAFVFAHGFFVSSEFSEKNCAMKATAVITRS